MVNYEDRLNNFNNDISDYDEVVIGSSIQNSRLSSPINTVLKELNLKIIFIFGEMTKKIIFVNK